ncbi:DUF5134 domain-containing protein [Amycolatopsis cihanbeyliensis]|uniref:Uncharacterized protein DUF5134 n=1 Tax=Amycolatopsis cihanbeyliensis TaxID=1128664 RepID=A0A542DHG2_AMYCI|nr:DUF5134 domain-containing protein [Amycolatopsis cihanbeyliensis]TQJ02505.1 uncharacterized protein DUF5134 [Amycolatopsis cihanbeyliensis]
MATRHTAQPARRTPARPRGGVLLVGLLVTVVFLGWGLWWLARAIDAAREYVPSTVDGVLGTRALTSAAHAVMSLGMAVMAFAMAV